jgi:thiamine pyrophosphokinase
MERGNADLQCPGGGRRGRGCRRGRGRLTAETDTRSAATTTRGGHDGEERDGREDPQGRRRHSGTLRGAASGFPVGLLATSPETSVAPAAKGSVISENAAVVFAGGDRPPRSVLARLPAGAFVIAADSGLEHASALGQRVDLVVGDLDSVNLDVLAAARAAGALVEAHPREKDATDLELALDAALVRDARAVTVVGGAGGRLDHLLANLTLLASPRFAGARVDAWCGPARVVVVRDEVDLAGTPGSTVTLLALGGPARSVRTEGLRYPLVGEDLEAGTSRGVSNELVETSARVSVQAGVVLTIQPDVLVADAAS